MQISICIFLWNTCLLIVLTHTTLCGQTIQEQCQSNLKAHESKSYRAFLKHFIALDSLLSNHPAVLYNLVATYSLNQNETKSVQTLQHLLRIDANEKIKTGENFGQSFFYVANSPWAKYEKNGTMFSADKLSNIIILKNILN